MFLLLGINCHSSILMHYIQNELSGVSKKKCSYVTLVYVFHHDLGVWNS